MERRAFVLTIPLLIAGCGGGASGNVAGASASGSTSSGSSGGGNGGSSGSSGGGSSGGSSSGSTGSGSGGTSGSSSGGGVGPGYDGVIAINAAGKTVNGAGTPINLRGLGLYGMQDQPLGAFHLQSEWGNAVGGSYQIGPNGPVWPLMAGWKPNFVRVALSAQVFLDLNFGVFSGAGSNTNPQWIGASATAGSNGTTITVNSTAGWFSAASGFGNYYLVNVSNPGAVPAGTRILKAGTTSNGAPSSGGTSITVSSPCSIQSGDILTCVGACDAPGFGREQILNVVQQARALGCYIFWDLHSGAPRYTGTIAGTTASFTAYCGGLGQPPFMNADDSALFWTGSCTNGYTGTAQSFPAWLATNFGSAAFNAANGYNGGAAGTYHDPAHGGASGIDDMVFELFNEPFLPFIGSCTDLSGASCSGQYAMLHGGNNSVFSNSNAGAFPNGCGIPTSYGGKAVLGSWGVLGYQQVVTALRAQGFTNVIQCNPSAYAADLNDIPAIYPNDALSPPQISIGWHPYQSSNGGNVPNGTGGTAQFSSYAVAAFNGSAVGHAVPIVLTEFSDGTAVGNTSGPSAANPDPYVSYIHSNVDSFNGTFGTGSFGCASFQWSGVLVSGTNGIWTELQASTASVTVTCSVSGTTMTVSAVSGGSLAANMMVTSSGPGVQGTYIVQQLGGSPGGIGTYQLSNTMGGGSGVTFRALLPSNGQGSTVYNWMSNHG